MAQETKREFKSFDDFTNLYSLSKTLRFELRPVGKTIENMREHLRYDEYLQTFLADQEIEDAYQALKPLFDSSHEEFITDSLESEIAKNIDFSEYLKIYRDKKNLKEKDFESHEKLLRNQLGETYTEAGEIWKTKKYLNYQWKKGSKIANGSDILSCQDILKLIKGLYPEDEKLKKIVEKTFKGFFTYFSGFNQNRENYYETGKEASTAVATRIVHENLPKFCDNILFFENRQEEYKNAYGILQELGRSLADKEGKALFSISADIFQVTYFNKCLSQKQIEQYNEKIGNANFLINLYNQAKREEVGFVKLSSFKKLYKQIGCGKKKTLFFALTHDKKIDADKVKSEGKEAFSVEEILLYAKKAGEKYFQGKSDDMAINTVPEFLELLKTRENYLGVYWSKIAINTISNKYFANWHQLKDSLKQAKVFKKTAKGSEDDVKIPDTVELEGLFQVLNAMEDWKGEGVFLRKVLQWRARMIRKTKKTRKEKRLSLAPRLYQRRYWSLSLRILQSAQKIF